MQRKKIACKKCGRLISASNLKKHENACKRVKHTEKISENWRIENGKYKCLHCGKEFCKNGISTHIWRVHGEGKLHDSNIGFANKSRIIWNKGKTKNNNESLMRASLTLKNKHETGELQSAFKNKKHTEEAKKKISEKLSKNNKGGRCKWYSFQRKNGRKTKVQGTWEYRFAKILDEIDENWIKIKKEKNHSFEWVDKNGNTHFYTPDFYSPKLNKYFEVKGYWWGNDKEKMQYVKEQYEGIVIDIVKKKELESFEGFFGKTTSKEELKENLTK